MLFRSESVDIIMREISFELVKQVIEVEGWIDLSKICKKMAEGHVLISIRSPKEQGQGSNHTRSKHLIKEVTNKSLQNHIKSFRNL